MRNTHHQVSVDLPLFLSFQQGINFASSDDQNLNPDPITF